MESISNGVEDQLIEGLSFKLPPGSSYITDRRKCTFWASGSNIYKPESGTKVLRFLLNGDDGTWLDPSTIRIQFALRNNETALNKDLRPLGGPHLFFRRARVMVGNQLAEDILDYNRCHEQFFSLMPDNVRDNIDIEGFGYRWDDKQNKYGNDVWSVETMPGVLSSSAQIVAFKPFLGLVMQPKLLPVKYAPIILELELVNSALDPIITPGVRNTNDVATLPAFNTINTSTNWQIENACIKADCCTLDNQLNNEYTSHLLSGKALPIKYSTFINQQSSVSGKSFSVQVARAVSRLQKCFLTFYKQKTPSQIEVITDKQAIKLYHPMSEVSSSIYVPTLDLEFQIQLGSKLYPEYPVRSISECFTILKQTLNLPDDHLHAVGIDFRQYCTNKFIFGMSFEKVPESSWTGTSTKAGQILIVKCSAVDQGNMPNDIATLMYITLVSEQILEVRDVGCSVYD